jgi:hypothetical protein
MIAFVAGGVVFLRGDSCTIDWRMSAELSPDKTTTIDPYSKTCHPRYSNAASKTKRYDVIVLRPASEPPPVGNRYSEADVVFEIEKSDHETEQGAYPIQFTGLAPENQIVIWCAPYCPSQNIRKKLHTWRGQTIHYRFQESPTGPIVDE